MPNVIESILSKNAEEQLRKLYDGLSKSHEEILKLSRVQLDFNGGSAVKTFSDFNKEMEKSVSIRSKVDQSIERTRLAEIRLQQAREKSFDSYEQKLNKQTQAEQKRADATSKAQAKEMADLQKAEGAYQRIQNSVNLLNKTYQDLAIRKQLGGNLTTKEEAQLLSLTNRLNMYQTALKKVDADIQKNQRNVGNYTSGWNGLSNSINQITREFPAFTFSAQTGFLALSNNIPILTDEISKLQKANKELIAQGKPITSVFSQILSSVFSLQTAMGVGILLFTLYGKEIGNFFKTMFDGISTIDETTKALNEMNEIRVASTKEVVKDGIELNQWLSIAKNVNLSYKEREIAAKKVLDQYPFWFERLGKEAILNGNVEKAVKGVNDALLARAKANAVVSKITENQSQIIDLEEEKFKIRQELIEQDKENARLEPRALAELKTTSDRNTLLDRYNSGTARSLSLKRSIIQSDEEISKLTATNNRLTSYANEESSKAVGLDYQQEKAKKEKNKALKQEIDYLASIYELRQRNAEILQNQAERDMNNEEEDFSIRTQAMENYYFQKEVRAVMAYEEENRLNDLSFEKQRQTYIKAIKEGTATQEALTDLEIQYLANRELIRTNYEEKGNQITIEKAKALKGVLDSIFDQNKVNIVSEQSLTDLRQVGLYLQGVGSETTLKGFKKLDEQLKKIGESERLRNLELLQIELQRNLSDQDNLKNQGKKLEENQAYQRLKAKELELLKNIQKTENESLEETARKLKEKAQAMADYLKSFTSGFFGSAGFPTLFKLLNDEIKGFGEDFATTFVTIAEIAQETINFLNQNQQAYYDRQYARLEREKDISIKYAGDSATAKEEIERQYEERKREIRIKEAKATRDLAIFNAIVNTAQAVVAALPNIALSVIAGVIGATQIALIASQPLPEFWQGTMNAPEGFALVDEKRPEVHTDKNGNIKSFGSEKGANKRWLNKGDKIYKSHEFFLQKMLSDNGISMHSEMANAGMQNVILNNPNGITKNDLIEVMRSVKEKEKGSSIVVSKTGVSDFIGHTIAKQKNMNDRFMFKNKKV